MACTNVVLKGLAQDCETNIGGVKNVFIAQYAEGVASSDTANTGYVTIATSGSSPAFEFKHFYFRKGAASATSTLNVDAANGVNFVSTELALTFAKQDTTKRIEMSALVLGDVMVVFEDANGKMWLLGKDEPVTATAAGAATGAAKTDANNYTITLTDESKTFPMELTTASAANFRALVGTSAT